MVDAMREITVKVHDISTDGWPDPGSDAVQQGRIFFIYERHELEGKELAEALEEHTWLREKFGGLGKDDIVSETTYTHWLEFPEPIQLCTDSFITAN
jgi:hypothetical protein